MNDMATIDEYLRRNDQIKIELELLRSEREEELNEMRSKLLDAAMNYLFKANKMEHSRITNILDNGYHVTKIFESGLKTDMTYSSVVFNFEPIGGVYDLVQLTVPRKVLLGNDVFSR